MKRNIRYIFSLLIYFASLSTALSAKSGLENGSIWGECHTKDQMRILGLYNGSSSKNISITNSNYEHLKTLLEDFNYWIDDQSAEGENMQFYKKLQDKYPNFSWHRYTHRLMFHWGYDWGDPYGHQALKKAFFNLNNLDEFKMTTKQHEIYNAFLYDIYREQEIREYMMTTSVEEFFGTYNAREFNHAIGALIYYTHLLGDHIEHANSHTEEAVLSVNQIMLKMEEEINNIMPNGTLRLRSAGNIRKFNREWKQLKNSGMNDCQLAKNTVEVLSVTLPPILERTWGTTFKNTGLQFIYKGKK